MSENLNRQNPQDLEKLTSELSEQPLLTTAVTEKLLQATQQLIDSQTAKPSLREKLQSRKFWMAILGAVSGVCGMLNAGDNTVAIGIFVALTAASILCYCFGEGTIDASRTKEYMQAASEIATILSTVLTATANGPLGDSSTDDGADAGTENGSADLPVDETGTNHEESSTETITGETPSGSFYV